MQGFLLQTIYFLHNAKCILLFGIFYRDTLYLWRFIMIQGFLILLAFQLLGESLVVVLALPLPGPVIGLVLLLVGLLGLGRIPNSLKKTSDGLLSNLALLFIPAGVGLVLHFDLLASEGWIILLALVISTILATLVTTALFQWLMKRVGGEQ